ncbi:MAG TPA: ATP-grasp domain-containing protein, partial [Chloroflexia bacterium]|nr:ATP-grasp domain-containing protein [Chloroflexia bacterium]
REGLLGVIAQFGGQTALNLINPLVAAGVRILGTSPESISVAEDRDKMAQLCERLGIPAPKWAIVHSHTELESFVPQIGFPVLVRPSYVLGGRGMRVVHAEADLHAYLHSLGDHLRKHPVLVDQFLEDATEIDVDAVSDGQDVYTVIMEQLERAGIHSGDSTCVYPPQTLSQEVISQVESYTRALVQHLKVVGLMNVQYAVKDGTVYLLEVNTRASRTVPFASKATGLPLARLATQVIMGTPLSELVLDVSREVRRVSVKVVVLPFKKFPTLVPVLGPEMQSTGETMGTGEDFATALRKARLGAGYSADAATEVATGSKTAAGH